MAEQENLLTRLRRIEGQVRGLARMIETGKSCEDILTQLLAVRAALDQAGLQIIARHIEDCLPDQPSVEQCQAARHSLQRILDLIMRIS